MEALISREDPLREISSIRVQVSCDGVSIRACAKRTNVQLVQLGDAFQERLGVRSKFCVIPRRMRPQLKMVSIL